MPLPWGLANPDGSIRKTNKASLVRELEKNVSPAETIIHPSSCIIDGMSMIQRLNANNKTFLQISESILSSVLCEGSQNDRIDVVFDVYRDMSIKNAERLNRVTGTDVQYKNIKGGHVIQQWRKFLCSSYNKSSLIKFLTGEWKQEQYRERLGSKSLDVTCESACFKIMKEGRSEVSELITSQEEADTRVFLHALHGANEGARSVVMTAEDTDIMVISLGLNRDIPCSIYQKSGTKNRTRYIDISKLASSLGEKVCDALIGYHSFTGCDTVSAFAGRGKLSALKLLKKGHLPRDFQPTWAVMGDDLFDQIQKFTCHMYTSDGHTDKVNELRYHLLY